MPKRPSKRTRALRLARWSMGKYWDKHHKALGDLYLDLLLYGRPMHDNAIARAYKRMNKEQK